MTVITNDVQRRSTPRESVQDVVVAIDDVSKGFAARSGLTPAVDHVSLEVRRLDFVSLVGPSGCGKTTLLNMAAGLATPDAGRVLFEGRRLAGPNVGIGYLTQEDTLLPWRDALANVTLPLEVKGVPRAERRERARDMLDRVGLGGFEKHLPRQLSGGMRKRLSLARTLVYNPSFLLLDEPFGALDAQTRRVMQDELRGIVAGLGLTVMLVTHDLDEAIYLSNRILLFSKRPARLIEHIDVPPRDPLQRNHRGTDEALRQHLWDRLAEQQEDRIDARTRLR